jgi:outer membrane protein assembly factor BamD
MGARGNQVWWSALTLAGALLVTGCFSKKSAPPVLSPEPGSAAAGASAASVDSSWALADRRFRRGDWEGTITVLERANLEMLPLDPRRSRMHFMMGESMFQQGDFLQAAREFRRVSDDTPGDPLASDALLRAGDSFSALWRRPELDPTYGQTAISTYSEVGNRFPGTSAAKQAQQRLAQLQDNFAWKQYKAGSYYMHLKAYDSAILYYRDVVATYPRSKAAPLALVDLVKAYYKLGYLEDVKETCGYIRRFHANAKGVAELCPSDIEAS